MPDSLEQSIQELRTALTAPISTDAPVGADITYNDDFRALKNEVDGLQTATGAVDFDWIAETSLEILQTTSKDLRVAAYLVVGQTQSRGMEGLAASLAGLRGLLDAFWEEMHPPARRTAARRNALQFVADYLGPWVKAHSFEEAEAPAVKAALEAGSALHAQALDRLGDDAPAWSGLLHTLEGAASRLEERAADQADASPSDGSEAAADATDAAESPDPAAAASSRPASPRPGDGASDASVPSEPQPTVAVRDPDGELGDTEWRRVVIQRAASVRDDDLSRVESYRLLRLLRWGALSDVPTASDGVTQVAPPDTAQRSALQDLARRDDHERLLAAAEQAFQAGNFWFWLDLQRMEVQAASALRPAYEGVAEAVRAETTRLVRRLPALPTLAFRDGTPFADAATQGWLDALQAGSAAASSGAGGDEAGGDRAGSDGADGAGDDLGPAFQEARALLADGSLDDALDRLRAVPHGASAQSRFRRRLYTARLCMEGGRLGVALPVLEGLAAEVDTYHLDRWQPSLAAAVWAPLYTCHLRLHTDGERGHAGSPGEPETHRDAAAAAYRRLCRLDPSAALALPRLPE